MLPHVTDLDALWSQKQLSHSLQPKPKEGHAQTPIEMPKNSAIGFVVAFFAVISGFALIWHIWWMAASGALAIFLATLVFAFREEDEIEIPADEIARFEREQEVAA